MDVSETGASGRGWTPAPTIFVRGLAGCVTVALVRVVATGRRGRRPLRLVCWRNPQRCRRCGAYSGAAHRGRCALRLRCCVGFERGAHRDGWSAVVAVGAGFHPRPDIKSKRLRRFTFSQRLLEEMRPFSASTTSVDISNRRRPKGGRYLVLNRYPGRPTPYISAQPAYRAQTSDRTSKVRGRGGWDAAGTMGPHTQ